jgi:hypothetical protein
MRRLIVAAAAAGTLMVGSGGTAQGCIDCKAMGPIDGGGVVAKGGGTTYLTLAMPREGTLVQAVSGQNVMRWNMVDGQYGVPTVAAGVTEGLSFDGRRLVLERFVQAYPKRTSGFVVLKARSLRVDRTIDLRGDFSYDALSPDGRYLYLIEHPEPNRADSYRVRAYDVAAGRLLKRTVTDPWEGPRMTGYPVSRVWSPDGVWAYTLYQQSEKKAFVHALDTANMKARCIDLPPAAALSNGMTITSDGSKLSLSMDATPTATVDTMGFSARVTDATPAPPPAPPKTDPVTRIDGSGSQDWLLAAAFGAVVLLGAAGALLVPRLHSGVWRPRRSG